MNKQKSNTQDAKDAASKLKLKGKMSEPLGADKANPKPKEPVKRANKSPYEVGVRRLVTPASQKQRKRGHVSNPKYQ